MRQLLEKNSTRTRTLERIFLSLECRGTIRCYVIPPHRAIFETDVFSIANPLSPQLVAFESHGVSSPAQFSRYNSASSRGLELDGHFQVIESALNIV